MHDTPNRGSRSLRLLVPAALIAALAAPARATQAASRPKAPAKLKTKFTNAAAFDTSKRLRELAKTVKPSKARPDRVNFDRSLRTGSSRGFAGDCPVESMSAAAAARS